MSEALKKFAKLPAGIANARHLRKIVGSPCWEVWDFEKGEWVPDYNFMGELVPPVYYGHKGDIEITVLLHSTKIPVGWTAPEPQGLWFRPFVGGKNN